MDFPDRSPDIGVASINMPIILTTARATNAAPVRPATAPKGVLDVAFARVKEPDWMGSPIEVFDVKD
jgi:hypothetical protein